MMCSVNNEARLVMLINKMTWQNPPGTCRTPGQKQPEVIISLPKTLVDAVERQGIVEFTVPCPSDVSPYVNKSCNISQLQHGDWIVDPATRCDWKAFMLPRKEGKYVRTGHTSPSFVSLSS